MGSGNSRLGSSRSRSGLKRRLLSSLFCGSSVSHTPIEIGDHMDYSSTESTQNLTQHHHVSVCAKQQSPSTFRLETGLNDFHDETGSSSVSVGDTSFTHSFSNHSENSELHSQQVNVNDSLIEAPLDGSSLKTQPPAESLSSDAPLTSIVGQDTGNLHSDGETIADASMDGYTAESSSDVSGSSINSQPLPRSLLLSGEQGSIGMGVLLVDVVSIHSNILSSTIAEISNREARRNTRRMFWDAFSRNSSRRNSDFPTVVFTTSHADDLGSHDRWLLDFSGDLHYDGAGRESRYSGTRSDHRSGRRWQSRYEMPERFHDVYDEQGWQGSLCATGRHPRGTCSCESSFLDEESGSHANISQSQIFMLAGALFEVLEEIHHHRSSLSLSMLTRPAPEAVVNSFPLKNHKKSYETGSGMHDAHQCHICLIDYEEGDKIRVLPCSHEYHMLCVDKWLKEVHGVCPLCRDDVCKGVAEGSTSNPEIPAL
ncbi:hypothetical protein P3X46_003918 [Hevea brasiliensis]|uniref:RING-type domain-containing protein n=1 Tax=Hevea brasiliensis TaxID=3981 RepID=A0ABQ9NAZ6_HEVBR|nr:uncharacterized RING finger protein C4G3.12c [Hevea brasiliensis]KAJ9188573.1 hypothetical protein P3X46_003918 [Hevea brasiliensis]